MHLWLQESIAFAVSLLANFFFWLLTGESGPLRGARPRKSKLFFLFVAVVVLSCSSPVVYELYLAPHLALRKLKGTVEGSEADPLKEPVQGYLKLDTLNPTLMPPTEEDAFLSRYVAVKPEIGGGKGKWAVVLRSDSKLDEFSGVVAEALHERGDKVVSAFRPGILEDKAFRHIYLADSSLLRKLQPVCDGVITGQARETFSKDNDLQGLTTARLTLTIRIFLTAPGELKGEFELSSKGGGFSQETARAQASERLGQELKGRLLKEIN